MYSYTMLAYLKQAEGEFESAAELFLRACAVEETLRDQRSNTSDRLADAVGNLAQPRPA